MRKWRSARRYGDRRRRTVIRTPKLPGSTDGIPRRIDIATEFAGRASRAEPLELLESGLGPLASTQTRETVARAESRGQALALLVMAPEFLRR